MSQMKFHPILFSTEMVKAILEGRKTMTRRVMKPQASADDIEKVDNWNDVLPGCKFGKVGDILWVRESFRYDVVQDKNGVFQDVYTYKNDFPDEYPKILSWKPSIHMPKIACRIFLKIKSVRVEQLHHVTGKDVLSEGVDNGKSNAAMGVRWENMQQMAFEELWSKIYGQESWQANPYVWVIEFERIEKPTAFNN